MPQSKWIVLVVAGIGAAGVGGVVEARQGPPPDHGLDWVTVGAPGNRHAMQGEGLVGVGGVDYEYRLTRTEVTVSQWLEFVQAYAPHWVAGGGHPRDIGFTGSLIDAGPSGDQMISPQVANYPANMGWRFAARYCNWLHNGKVSEAWAFETGAYDTSTFVTGPNGIVMDQATRSAGAQFWIPSTDEWVKAAYHDPNRYGPGQEGYWTYPLGSNAVPVSGFPWDGGETNAGDATYPLLGMDVGSYPGSASPWGLLDLSGGEEEWTETIWGNANRRFVMGSRVASIDYMNSDAIWFYGNGSGFITSVRGLRVASAVPGPAPGAAIVVATLLVCRSRRR